MQRRTRIASIVSFTVFACEAPSTDDTDGSVVVAEERIGCRR